MVIDDPIAICCAVTNEFPDVRGIVVERMNENAIHIHGYGVCCKFKKLTKKVFSVKVRKGKEDRFLLSAGCDAEKVVEHSNSTVICATFQGLLEEFYGDDLSNHMATEVICAETE